MDALPDELQCVVASFLPPTDCASYRLIGKRFANIGAEVLFSTFRFNASWRSYERFSTRLILLYAKYVRTLQYLGYPYPDDEFPCGNSSIEEQTLWQALIAFASADIPITTLRARELVIGAFSEDNFLSHVTQVCASVTTAEIQLSSPADYRNSPISYQTQLNLVGFLGGLWNVTNLRLSFGPEDRLFRPKSFYVLDTITPPQHVWPSLTSLSLVCTCLLVQVSALEELLAPHRRRLQCLELRELSTYSGEDTEVEEWGIQQEQRRKYWRGIVDVFEGFEQLIRGCVLEASHVGEEQCKSWTVVTAGGEVDIKTNVREWLVDQI
ncbi:hypothetical protein FB567DRAFT_194177 [Paraphoma chrysanthemicola]|uniref:F-box domain-containing protein n=1 Tax=Paraphoma chrysanthemicola TaxID=798071 RepID=A0A8K0VT61_9PLEO|nr:hypothetical protein FB567DRAFT_194177 [Paraphoma chrysanthemicola]